MSRINLFDLFIRIGVDDQASDHVESLASKLGSGLKAAAKVGVAAVGTASAGIMALTKSAIDNYAEYEQLVGGVETLFKTSADTVQKYASEAYKTAGLSANEYMSTVTSFSASLIAGLGGDTDAAAEYANRAIVSMSDNANKMGTSIEMIQNAYQGFAKQNYTMLDNLKLGYGGTQAEMQRLIAEAAEMTDIQRELGISVDKSSMSFDNIVNAIEVMQANLGIAGATAEEAATTISGSVAATKSAWSNLVTGIADDTADFGGLIDNFVESAVTAAGNIIPRLQTALGGIGRLITGLAPQLANILPPLLSTLIPALTQGAVQLVNAVVQSLPMLLGIILEQVPYIVSQLITIIPQLVTGLLSMLPAIAEAGIEIIAMLGSGISSGLPGIIEMLPEIIVGIIAFFEENFESILDTGIGLLEQLGFGLLEAIPDLVSKLPEIITAITGFLTSNLPAILDRGIAFLLEFATGVLNAIPDMVAALPEVIAAITNFITQNYPMILAKGVELLGELIKGILNAIPSIAANLPKVINAIIDAIQNGWTAIRDAGSYLLEGLWSGIGDKVAWLKGKVAGVVDTIKSWFTGSEGFDTHSPSRWSRKVFGYVMDGGGEGLEDGLPDMMRTVASVGASIKNGLQMDMGTAEFSVNGGARGGSSGADMATGTFTIIVQSVLDGKVIGETAYQYAQNKAKAYGG